MTTKQEFVDMYNLSKKHNRQMAYKFHFYIKDREVEEGRRLRVN